MSKQFSAACERNREPILSVLRQLFADRTQVLEIGSGTGQHAVFFASELSHLIWQTADLPQNHSSIIAWQEEAHLPNVLSPLALDVNDTEWPTKIRDRFHTNRAQAALTLRLTIEEETAPFDAVFSANTCHIMSWEEVALMFTSVSKILGPGGIVCVYGPFKYAGQFTSESNRQFDASLKRQASHMGIRDFEAIDTLAKNQGLKLMADYKMPANNQLLVWQL